MNLLNKITFNRTDVFNGYAQVTEQLDFDQLYHDAETWICNNDIADEAVIAAFDNGVLDIHELQAEVWQEFLDVYVPANYSEGAAAVITEYLESTENTADDATLWDMLNTQVRISIRAQ